MADIGRVSQERARTLRSQYLVPKIQEGLHIEMGLKKQLFFAFINLLMLRDVSFLVIYKTAY